MKKEKPIQTVTPREYASKHGVAYTTVMKWLQKDLVPGAYKETLPSPFTGYVYRIPEDASPPELKPGPKPKPKKTNSPAGKQAGKKTTKAA